MEYLSFWLICILILCNFYIFWIKGNNLKTAPFKMSFCDNLKTLTYVFVWVVKKGLTVFRVLLTQQSLLFEQCIENNFSLAVNFLVICCAIWYHLYNLRNVKNTLEGVFFLVKKACNFTKSDIRPWVFSRFLNNANVTKSRKGSNILWSWISFQRRDNQYSPPSKI